MSVDEDVVDAGEPLFATSKMTSDLGKRSGRPTSPCIAEFISTVLCLWGVHTGAPTYTKDSKIVCHMCAFFLQTFP